MNPIEAQPIVPDIPTHRATSKTRLRALLYPQCPVPRLPIPLDNSVEQLASSMFSKQLFKREHLAMLAAAMPARMFKTTRPVTAFEGEPFFTGGYVGGNLVGVSNHARDYSNVTTYLAAFLKQRTSFPFASVGL